MVSQFISPDNVGLLKDLDFDFPEGIHAIGRLDNNSEGLLILTTNKKLTRILFSAEVSHERSYLVMVKNVVSEETLANLKSGVNIKTGASENHLAKPVDVELVKNGKEIYLYASDIRESYAHTWLLITLTEGKFRQVRKMVMSVKHKCLRLIRVSISDIKLGNLKPGEVKEFEEEEFFKLLGIPVDHYQKKVL